MRERFLLAADIGGTFSRFALFRFEENASGAALSLLADSKLKLSTAGAPSFAALLQRLRTERTPGGYTLLPSGRGRGHEIAGAALGVPGPVEGGRCRAPNIPWELEESDIDAVCGLPGVLLNDFAAQARACFFPEILGRRCLLGGTARPHAPAALVGAGTGLGHALLLPASAGSARMRKFQAGSAEEIAPSLALPADLVSRKALEDLGRRVLPSEAGHTVFGFVGEAEAEFEAFMRWRSGRAEVTGDMAVGGYGLSMLHAFHANPRDSGPALARPAEIAKLIDKHPDVLEWFARFYGRACRNFTLACLALGGVYLSGGMLAHLPGLPGHPAFAAEFMFSETKAYLLRDIPVFWVSNQDAGLWGAAVAALRFAA